MITGPYRESINAANHEGGGIHDDRVASKLGFRGGTVAGSIHLDLFPPLLLEAFGKEWFETGSLSMGFKNATTSKEPVRAVLGDGPGQVRASIEREDGMLVGDGTAVLGDGPGQVRASIEREDGMLVGEGTATVGAPIEPSALRAIDMTAHAAVEPRILAGLSVGEEIPTTRHTISPKRQEELLANGLCTEPLDWYSSDSPWGGPIVLPQQMVHVLYLAAVAHITPKVAERGGGVGLFGAIELANVRGPLRLGESYDFGGRILAIGESPKTEYTWFEVQASNADGTVAEMVMQLRWMKASSPQYADES
jgi:hypothetical protein